MELNNISYRILVNSHKIQPHKLWRHLFAINNSWCDNMKNSDSLISELKKINTLNSAMNLHEAKLIS